MRLAGRAALITGASQGLGREIARQFVREGASIAICARDEAMLEETARELSAIQGPGQKVCRMVCDVSSEEDVSRFVSFALGELGSLQILVSNAGVLGPKGSAETVDLKAWKQTVEINLFGAILLCREVIPHFKSAGYGKIVTLSGGGATTPFPFMSAYAASKAALVRLAETLAVELKPFSIDVNAVAPGAMNTRMMEEALAAGPEKVGAAYYEKVLRQKQEGGVPPEKAAGLCAFLASAESDGITGRLISAQWDPWETLADRREELAGSDIYTLRRIVPEDRGKNWV
jgi:NAD(P)-dependent dehydrogenase (short-subunit alcohol dehydrogenase family)